MTIQRSFSLESTLAGQRHEPMAMQDVMEIRDKFLKGADGVASEIDRLVDSLEEPLRSTFAQIATELRKTSQRLQHVEATPETVVGRLNQAIADGKKMLNEPKPKQTYGLC